jgi:resuscitation-promoting factor RpfA
MFGDGLSARRPQRSIVNSQKNKNLSRALRGGLAALALTGASVAMVGPAANAADGATWDALAECESGGSWSTSTGNGFSGGLQFTPSTWAAHGGTGSAENASRAEQIAVAENVLDSQGWGAWPACSSKLGLSGGGDGGGSQVSSQSAEIQQAPAEQAPVAEAPVQQQAPVQQAPVQQAPAPAAAPAVEAPAVSGETYAVQSGDTLATIAESMGLQGGWEDLFAANTDTVSDPNLIFVDQVLQVPAQ